MKTWVSLILIFFLGNVAPLYAAPAPFDASPPVSSQERARRMLVVSNFISSLLSQGFWRLRPAEADPTRWPQDFAARAGISEFDWEMGWLTWAGGHSARYRNILDVGENTLNQYTERYTQSGEEKYQRAEINRGLPQQTLASLRELIQKMNRWITVKPTAFETLIHGKNEIFARNPTLRVTPSKEWEKEDHQIGTDAELELETYGVEKRQMDSDPAFYQRWRKQMLEKIERALVDNHRAALKLILENPSPKREAIQVKLSSDDPSQRPIEHALTVEDLKKMDFTIQLPPAEFCYSAKLEGESAELIFEPNGIASSELARPFNGLPDFTPTGPNPGRDSDWFAAHKIRLLNSTLLSMHQALRQEPALKRHKQLQLLLGQALKSHRDAEQKIANPHQLVRSGIPWEVLWWGYSHSDNFWAKRNRVLGFNLPMKAMLEGKWRQWWGRKFLQAALASAALSLPADYLMNPSHRQMLSDAWQSYVVSPWEQTKERWDKWLSGWQSDRSNELGDFSGLNRERGSFGASSDQLTSNEPWTHHDPIFSARVGPGAPAIPRINIPFANYAKLRLPRYEVTDESPGVRHRLITRVPIGIVDGKFFIPGVDGAELKDLKAAILFPKDDRRAPRSLENVKLHWDPQGGYYVADLGKDAAVLKVNPGIEVVYEAVYQPIAKSEPPPTLYVRDPKLLAAEAQTMREAGLKKMGRSIAPLGTQERPVLVDNLTPALASHGRYSFVPPRTDVQGPPGNPYAPLVPFIDDKGLLCIHCNHAAELAETFLSRVLDPGEGTILKRGVIKLDTTSGEWNYVVPHGVVAWNPHNRKENQLPVIFDVTPPIEDPRNKEIGTTIESVRKNAQVATSRRQPEQGGSSIENILGGDKVKSSLDRGPQAKQPKEIIPPREVAPPPGIVKAGPETPPAKVNLPAKTEELVSEELELSVPKTHDGQFYFVLPQMLHRFRSRGQEGEEPKEKPVLPPTLEGTTDPDAIEERPAAELEIPIPHELIAKIKEQRKRLIQHPFYPRQRSINPYQTAYRASGILIELLENPKMPSEKINALGAELVKLSSPSLYAEPGEAPPASVSEILLDIRRAVARPLATIRRHNLKHKRKKHEAVPSVEINREALRPMVNTWKSTDFEAVSPACRELRRLGLKASP